MVDVQWHCNHRPPLWYHYFPAQSSLGADILVYWIGKIVRTCAPGGSRTLDFLHTRRAPYPLGQALRFTKLQSVCVYSNSRNDVPRVAQRYGTIAAHTRRRASVLVVFVVFCVHMYSFAGLIRRTPPPTFSDTAITDHYFPAQSSLGAHILVYWIGKIVRTCAPSGSRTLDFLRARRAPYPLGQALRWNCSLYHLVFYMLLYITWPALTKYCGLNHRYLGQ